ncbi:hypothetical protein [Mycolicibacterium smegmatis]|uniref:hypothetical protein n=1 Tax=Mycolicibacterium smegmatis TaxID=1772 RepID=UPI0005D80365|nr:hypothetical protein [Mycolicibacterium smegmatis]CKI23751.1 Uncharacterised protein [Mycolicibacterium smegmatis]
MRLFGSVQTHSRDQSFVVLRHNMRFVVVMAAGSITGTVVGALLLGVIPSLIIVPLLAALLALSAIRVWRHA